MSTTTEIFNRFIHKARTIADLNSASAVLGWDQETYMPDGAAEVRAEQLATLSALSHQMVVDAECGDLIDRLTNDSIRPELEDWQHASVREFKRTRDQSVRLPEEFVRELSKTTALAQQAWKKAKEASDFGIFLEPLSHIIDLKRRHAELLGYEENPYDALIDLYEPGMTVAQLRPIFDRLREGTTRMLKKIDDSGVTVDDTVLFTDFDREKQLNVSKEIVGALGFDFGTGRVDLSAHPFCTSFGITDVRLTTRIFSDDLRSCLFGLIHEAGHGMYEQGFHHLYARTPVAEGISMGIHESQSLFWENMIGRSLPFWQWAFPKLQATFPERLGGLDGDEFFRIVNVMKPSFIRVEADELTYNLHIILRFEIEEALINGTMEVGDIPGVWNDKMRDYLGITPPNDALGCLQDVHWSFGGQGYFPSYTLGKLYAAMLYEALLKEIPDLEEQIGRGEFAGILSWLRQNIHRWGKVKTASQIVQDVCGKPLTEEAFIRYIEAKIDRVYR